MEGILFHPKEPDLREWRSLIPLMELFCSGTHPGVVGYEYGSDGFAREVLAPRESWEGQLDWGIQVLQDAILATAGRLCEEGSLLEHESVRELIQEFGKNPDLDEVTTLANWPCQSEQNRVCSRVFVPRLCIRDYWDALLGKRFLVVHWRNGTVRMNGVARYGAYSFCRRIGTRLN